MRATVTLDPDVAKLVRHVMRERGETLSQILNHAVRQGLSAATGSQPADKPYRQPVFDMGVPLVDLTKALALAGGLEDQDIVAKMRRGK